MRVPPLFFGNPKGKREIAQRALGFAGGQRRLHGGFRILVQQRQIGAGDGFDFALVAQLHHEKRSAARRVKAVRLEGRLLFVRREAGRGGRIRIAIGKGEIQRLRADGLLVPHGGDEQAAHQRQQHQPHHAHADADKFAAELADHAVSSNR